MTGDCGAENQESENKRKGESAPLRWLVKVGVGGGHLAGSNGKCEVPAVPAADYCFVFRIVSFSAVCCACVCFLNDLL